MAEVEFDIRGANARLLECPDTEVVACGMAGTGKSLAACLKLHLTALKYPGFRGMVVRATQVSLAATTLQTLQKLVLPDALASGDVRWYGGSAKEPASFQYRNGSRIAVGGADKPEKLLSLEVDRVLIDEAIEIELEFYETLLTRLRGARTVPYRQVILATNPGHPSHWIRRRVNTGEMTLLTSTHRDNPAYTNRDGTYTEDGADYARKLDKLTGTRRARLRDGQWVTAEGVVYTEWNEGVHVIAPFAVPAEWPRYVTVDFGYTNPFVAQLWARDGDGRAYLIKEWVRTGMLVEDHAHAIQEHLLKGQPRPSAVICDHDAEGRATLEKYLRLPTTPAYKIVTPGIQAMEARLKVQGDGKPRLLIVRDALIGRDPAMEEAALPQGLLEEITGYVWDDRKGVMGRREAPLKVNDHSCDAARYLVADWDLRGEGRLMSPARAPSSAKGTYIGSRYSRPVV